jgi:hypothetical protein
LVETAWSFSTPKTASLSRAITANHLKLSSRGLTSKAPTKSLLRMSEAVAVSSSEPSEPEEPLFEGPFVGIKRDYGARLPLYGSDIKDGLNLQVRFS